MASLDWETSIYPIVKDILLNNTDEDQLSDIQVNDLSNIICKAIDKKFEINLRTKVE